MPIASTPIQTSGNPLTSALQVLSRIAPPPNRPPFDIGELVPHHNRPQPTTIEHLAVSLIDMGLPADRTTLAVAESFARVGVPITASSISAARATLVRIPGSSPASIALASAIGVPQSPGVLRSLATVVQGLPGADRISVDAAQLLSIKVEDITDAKALTLQVNEMIGNLSQSAESRIYHHEAIRHDPRVSLLSLAAGGHPGSRGADHLARHIEGQQVLNTAAYQVAVSAPLYFAFYALYPGGHFIPVETQILLPPDDETAEQQSDKAGETRFTIRVSTMRLGTVEALLAVRKDGRLRCELRAQTDLAFRLFRRFAPDLGQNLVATGWDVRQISVTRVRDYNPLWFGGDSLTQPRHRLDSRV